VGALSFAVLVYAKGGIRSSVLLIPFLLRAAPSAARGPTAVRYYSSGSIRSAKLQESNQQIANGNYPKRRLMPLVEERPFMAAQGSTTKSFSALPQARA
jgi:hypothetical protein